MVDLKYTEILKLNKSLSKKIDGKPYKIGILSNVTVNSIKEILEYSCHINEIKPEIQFGNFDNIVQDSMRFSGKDCIIIFYDILLVVDQINDFFEDIEEAKYISIKQKLFSEIDMIFDNLIESPTVIFNSFSSSYFFNYNFRSSKLDIFVNELNEYILERKTLNTIVLKIDKIFTQLGIKNSIDYRFYYSSKAPYTFEFQKAYVNTIQNIILRNTGNLKKAIIFDCDNTLWKGIIGEDVIENIDMSPNSKIGSNYNLIQKIAVFLSRKGVIVGLCSKNNEADVSDVLKKNNDIILKEEYITIKKINWKDKASNLRDIASELNISTNSLVFVDDSNFEINLIKKQLPDILTIQVPEDISKYPEIILNYVHLNFNLVPNETDLNKTKIYHQQAERLSAKKSFYKLEDYLSSLQIELEIHLNNINQISRISQLTQKTNQFNLTTHRYTENQIDKFINDRNYDVFTSLVKDKFGDNGITALCISKADSLNPKNVLLDVFLMSCRIIGRNIEYAFLYQIIKVLFKKGYDSINAEYIPSKKNAQVEDFFEKSGFLLIKENGHKYYSLSKDNFNLKEINYIKINMK